MSLSSNAYSRRRRARPEEKARLAQYNRDRREHQNELRRARYAHIAAALRR